MQLKFDGAEAHQQTASVPDFLLKQKIVAENEHKIIIIIRMALDHVITAAAPSDSVC